MFVSPPNYRSAARGAPALPSVRCARVYTVDWCCAVVTFKMFNPKRALFLFVLIALLLEPILGRKGFSGGHSYPKSGGLSGGGHRSGGLSGGGHGYPSSGGIRPSSGGSHGYPSSGGLSGGGSHGYPSSGGLSGGGSGSHGYPPGGGLSGGGSGGSHTYPSSGGKPNYPSSGHSYPSGGGLSGNGRGYPQQKPAVHHTTNNYHYHYTPPQQISYSPVRGAAPVHYPVYHGTPPTYVYQYKDSGSKYGTLLAGLALLNLGTLGVAAYAASGHGGGGSRTQYTPTPGEVCKFAVKKDNGDYEETKIDCKIISSFIYDDQAQSQARGTNTTTSVVTVTNTTVTNTTNMVDQPATPGPVGDVLYKMLPNGTLVPVNNTGVPGGVMVPGSPVNVTQNVTGANGSNGVVTTSVVTTTTTNTTLVNALDVKGKPVEVTPGMQCFVIRNSPVHNMRKSVPCGLLQTYADKSIKPNSAARNVPMFTIVAAIVALCVGF
ncbi:hypothetical protein PYW08_003980 [Mythimna loreyi]|uniref:Uncharacterized protein n=1 Tax=Mythimna loreyi TaxID=667449 RepID=A0ACC2QWE8_9NEOP|nr:hypothetical protein PYW08_003980 [Mythimna loreyi]